MKPITKKIASGSANTSRFARKQEMILTAAQDILYREGMKGMTLAKVAEKVNLNAASIIYYFKKKEDLAAACFLAGIARLDAIMDEASRAQNETARLRRVFEAFFAHHRAIRLGQESQIVPLGEMRSLDEPHLSTVTDAFVSMFRKARGLFDGPHFDSRGKAAKTALTHMLLEQIFWSTGWLYRFDVEDYPRALDRTCDIYLHGLAVHGTNWNGEVTASQAERRGDRSDKSREDFFIAATRLINNVGYGGASVERISAELNVTKGSFYHHNPAKEDLVASCFQRSLDVIKSAQFQAIESHCSQWEKLDQITATLIDFQMSGNGPLLRSSVLTALPAPLRASLTDRLNRTVDRFAGMIADGIAEGSLRPVDPLIAAQMLKVMINAVAEAPYWVRGLERKDAPALYAKPMLQGVLA